MSSKVYSVLISVFLASTLVHEIRPASILRPEEWEDDNNNNNNIYVNASLTVISNADDNLYTVVNTTGNSAVIIDIGNNIIALLNGNSGAAVIVDLQSNDGVCLDCGVWSASEQTIEDFLCSLTSLESLLKSSEGESFECGNAPEKALSEVNTVINDLIINIESTLEWDPEMGLQLVIAISKNLIELFEGDLKGVLKLGSSEPRNSISDLAGIVNYYRGIATVVVKIGGLEYALSKGVEIDLDELSTFATGVEALAYLLRQIVKEIDIGCLASILNNPTSLFELIVNLGSNLKVGETGVYRVLHSITLYLDNKSSLEDVVTTTLQFLSFSAQVDNEDLSSEFNSSLRELKDAIDECNSGKDLSEELSEFIETVDGLISGEIEIKGVDIARIIQILIDGVSQDSSSSIEVLLKVVLQLQTIVDVKTSLSTSLFALILNVNSAYGVQMLRSLEIDININLNIQGTSIIASILKEESNLNKICQDNLYETLCDIPVLETLIRVFESSISSCGEELTVRDLLSSDNEITVLILGLFQTCGDVSLGVDETVIVEVKSDLDSCTSLNFYLDIEIDAALGVALG